ncbi:hypothetical protein ACIP5Y_09465 [Nocardia sp. NPDC088792]|uniref:hypothetical protein n=1 Tax=Nocardia sp. NPDC088792 TaxID=3364332 RepID=UPI0038027E02
MTTATVHLGRSYTPNLKLAALMRELRLSNKGFARLMGEISRQDGGQPVTPDGSTLSRYKSGQHQPSARSCQVMVKVLEQICGHPVTPADIGYSEEELSPSTLAFNHHDLSNTFFPSRLTFAGICIWCQRRGCTSDRCTQRHHASRWRVCPVCDGTAIGCECTYGMILAEPAATTAPTLTVVPR